MNSRQKQIPFDKRFHRGKIVSLEQNIGLVELVDCKWTRYARVRQDHFPGKKITGFSRGDLVDVFLLGPVQDFPDSRHGSIAWGRRDENPWVTAPPEPGQLTQATAIRYLEPQATAIQYLEPIGVFVQLKNGIEALLRAGDVPGGTGDITRAVDLGDKLVVQVTSVRRELLEVDVSVNAALKTLRRQEEIRRKKEFKRPAVEVFLLQERMPEKEKKIRLSVLGPDEFFSRNLKQWLEGFGISCRVIATGRQLLNVLQAVNHPTHVMATTTIWNDPFLGAKLQESLSRKNIQLLWLKTGSQAAIPFDAPALVLPLNIGYLVQWLSGAGELPETGKATQPFSFDDYQQRHVQELANRLLEEICGELGLQGALWCRRERKGVYMPRASWGLDQDAVDKIQLQLGQSDIATCIEANTGICRAVHRAGPLRQVAPATADMVFCLPLAYIPLHGEEEVSRGLAFFYRQADHPDESLLKDRLQPYIPAMQALIATLHFAFHNETLSTFANLGINSAAYLHELGQAAHPIKDFLDTMARENKSPGPQEWRRLRKELGKLLVLAKSDLSVIRKQQSSLISVAGRLRNIARLFSYRVAPFGCSFRVIMPDHPMPTKIPGLLFDQIINNLLDNAYHFIAGMPVNTGHIKVDVSFDFSNPARPLTLDVTDNGPGIRASMTNKIFNLRDTEKEIGTGMGLFIIQNFLHGLGGEIKLVESIRWQKTTFRVSLPILLDKYFD